MHFCCSISDFHKVKNEEGIIRRRRWAWGFFVLPPNMMLSVNLQLHPIWTAAGSNLREEYFSVRRYEALVRRLILKLRHAFFVVRDHELPARFSLDVPPFYVCL